MTELSKAERNAEQDAWDIYRPKSLSHGPGFAFGAGFDAGLNYAKKQALEKARALVAASPQSDHEPEREAALQALESIRELIVRFARIGDKQAGEWLDRHLRTIRDYLDAADQSDHGPGETSEDLREATAIIEDALLFLERIPPPEEEMRAIGRGLWDEVIERGKAFITARAALGVQGERSDV